MKEISEKKVEKRLVDGVEALGGMAIKFPPIFFRGFPDRIVLMPKGVIVFVELKKPGETARKIQDKVHARLRGLGFRVEVLGDFNEVDTFLICL